MLAGGKKESGDQHNAANDGYQIVLRTGSLGGQPAGNSLWRDFSLSHGLSPTFNTTRT
jgi:hypothetical protein